MIKVGILSICLFMLAACSDSEPVATTYKKSMAGGAPQAATGAGTTPGTTPGTGDATAVLLKQGTDLYVAKCASCHLALTAPSAKKGATAARITASAAIASHNTVRPFPTPAEASALEAAMK